MPAGICRWPPRLDVTSVEAVLYDGVRLDNELSKTRSNGGEVTKSPVPEKDTLAVSVIRDMLRANTDQNPGKA